MEHVVIGHMAWNLIFTVSQPKLEMTRCQYYRLQTRPEPSQPAPRQTNKHSVLGLLVIAAALSVPVITLMLSTYMSSRRERLLAA